MITREGKVSVNEFGDSLTAASPTAISVGVASTSILAENLIRKGLRLVNTSNAIISLGIGAPAVLYSGITLYPGGVWNMDEFDFTTKAINGIASIAASNIAVQEFNQ